MELRCMADAHAIFKTLDIEKERAQFEKYAPLMRMPEYRLNRLNGMYDYGDTEDAFNGFLAAKIALIAELSK